MTGMLISVMNLEETALAIQSSPDILDMKNPRQGALGALSVSELAEIVAFVNGRTVTSATIGDLPMDPDHLVPAVEAMAETGVDIVKVGFFQQGNLMSCIEALSHFKPRGVHIVAVMMADQLQDMSLIRPMSEAGFLGVMLDTAQKNGKSLTDYMALPDIAEFVRVSSAVGLKTGLAGSLQSTHVPVLSALLPDYLGFRGAVCAQGSRIMGLDKFKIDALRDLLQKYNISMINQALSS